MSERPLQLVAPWWAWRRQMAAGVALSPRTTRPHFQKFDRPDFVPGFLEDPQRSFKFVADDEVTTYSLVSGLAVALQGIRKKAELLFAPRTKAGTPNPSGVLAKSSHLRKLFLDTHRRSYAVVCEVHCDAAGFPSATGEELCQAGFVVRRRYLQYAKEAEKPARALLGEIAGLQLRLAELSSEALALAKVDPRRPTRAQKLQKEGRLELVREELRGELVAKRTELQRWKEEAGAYWVHEGWVPSALDGVGSWQVLEDEPGTLTEATFPLYPLIVPEDVPRHDARGRVIYFGIIPTSSLDCEPSGTPRFDDQHTYELRCFVRRHKPGCPRRDTAPDCPGELYWSAPSEPYRLAAQFDVVGTSQRPITIQMPDLGELAALVQSRPLGSLSPMRMVQKQTLQPKVSGTSVSGGTMGGAAICFFAIPLITIVAVFLFNIFLPIVVFIFGLWFLLALRFCIPPSFSLDAGLNAELSMLASLQVDLDASFSISFTDPDTGLVVTRNELQVKADLVAGVSGAILGGAAAPDSPLHALPVSELFEVTRTLDALDDLQPAGDPLDQTQPGLDLTAALELEPRETHQVHVS
jgi:hypothetical protein